MGQCACAVNSIRPDAPLKGAAEARESELYAGRRRNRKTGYLPWIGHGPIIFTLMHLALAFQGIIPLPRREEGQMGGDKGR